MSKKVLSAEEKLKKYGRSIIGIGIVYLILELIIMFFTIFSSKLDLVSLIEFGVIVAVMLGMIIGVKQKKKYGVVFAWIFEAFLVALVILAFKIYRDIDLVKLIVAIFLPSDIINYAKALKS